MADRRFINVRNDDPVFVNINNELGIANEDPQDIEIYINKLSVMLNDVHDDLELTFKEIKTNTSRLRVMNDEIVAHRKLRAMKSLRLLKLVFLKIVKKISSQEFDVKRLRIEREMEDLMNRIIFLNYAMDSSMETREELMARHELLTKRADYLIEISECFRKIDIDSVKIHLRALLIEKTKEKQDEPEIRQAVRQQST